MARIVFDLDGTLIDSAPDIRGIANAILEREGKELISLLQARDFIGNGASVFVRKMREAQGISDSDHDRILKDFTDAYVTAVDLTVPYPGVEAALVALKEAGHVLGICTNKPIVPTRAVIKHLGLDKYFDVMIGGDSLPVHKPDPAPLHKAFAQLGEGEVIYVGDSDVDAETAKRAFVPFLLFTEGYLKVPVDSLTYEKTFNDFALLPDLVAQVLGAKS
jgi:phosphoglycolate phosphatase